MIVVLGLILTSCATADEAAALLAAFGERPVAWAVAEGKALTLAANPAAGTWTILARDVAGHVCVAASGRTAPEEPA